MILLAARNTIGMICAMLIHTFSDSYFELLQLLCTQVNKPYMYQSAEQLLLSI
jgi:hypothetical protein